jgi:hypothetical protein
MYLGNVADRQILAGLPSTPLYVLRPELGMQPIESANAASRLSKHSACI